MDRAHIRVLVVEFQGVFKSALTQHILNKLHPLQKSHSKDPVEALLEDTILQSISSNYDHIEQTCLKGYSLRHLQQPLLRLRKTAFRELETPRRLSALKDPAINPTRTLF